VCVCVCVCVCVVCGVCVVSAIQHAKRKRHIVICGLSGSTTFFPHSLTKDKTFGKKYRIQNVCFDFLHNFCSKNLSFQEKCRAISWLHTGLHIRYALFLSNFITLWFSRKIFENNTQMSNFKESRPVGPSCAMQTDWCTDRRTDGRPDTLDEANGRF